MIESLQNRGLVTADGWPSGVQSKYSAWSGLVIPILCKALVTVHLLTLLQKYFFLPRKDTKIFKYFPPRC